ncbi:hypothetical protein TWF281_002410 [Arthrobotrys megalospora]
MEVTKTLHELLTIWSEVRRRIVAALSLTTDIPSHPFVLSQHVGSETEAGLKKPRGMLQDQLGRIDSLTEKTKALNSLVFNLANLHDSRAAIEEARAANAAATSLQRITSLTFVYLPITLAAVSTKLAFIEIEQLRKAKVPY